MRNLFLVLFVLILLTVNYQTVTAQWYGAGAYNAAFNAATFTPFMATAGAYNPAMYGGAFYGANSFTPYLASTAASSTIPVLANMQASRAAFNTWSTPFMGVIDYLTHEIKARITTDCFYFVIEEDYDGLGNDALLTNGREFVRKYDLKRFLSEKEECQPLWTYNIRQQGSSEIVNWINLEGRHMVIVHLRTHIHFIDSVLGTEAPLENENSVIGCIEVDHNNRNAIYFLARRDLNRYEYVH